MVLSTQINSLIKQLLAGRKLGFILFLPVFLLLFSVDLDSKSFSKASAAEVPVYRFWNKFSTFHRYTISTEIKSILLSRNNWRYMGVAFRAFDEPGENLVPVYGVWCPHNKSYLYTTSESERDIRINRDVRTCKYTGIQFYVYGSEQTDSIPVYHIWDRKNQNHLYITSPGKKSCLESYYSSRYKYKGIAFWIPEQEADLSDDTESCITGLGPKIKVGLWEYTRSDLSDDAFRIDANRRYKILDQNRNLIAVIPGNTTTRVKYNGDKQFRVYSSIDEVIVSREVQFEAADGRNNSMIFDANRPSSDYDHYRGKIKLRYYDTDGSSNDRIWVINELPMEHYTWGNSELTGTGDMDYNKVMAVVYRTYGYWKRLYSTQWTALGFHVISTPANQKYYGYDYEKNHERIRQAAIGTKGKILKYGSKIALAPYSSWTDGRTRSFEERWGSSSYPWCQSVPDPYGKHPWMSTAQLEASGNHMVGISANGAVKLANNKGWSWVRILNYYLKGIKIVRVY